ncbi:MAG: hypothetical protein Q9174_000745 [Haloplaca sp. 1 TL-2023]
MLDGYEQLPGDCQGKVQRALKQGHVDDDDWRGDAEMNRPGMKGFRSAATMKKRRAKARAKERAKERAEEKKALLDAKNSGEEGTDRSADNVDDVADGVDKAAEDVDGKDRRSKSASQKRGHAAEEDFVDEEVKKPSRKKTKATAEDLATAHGETKEKDIPEPEDGDPATRPKKAAANQGERLRAAGKGNSAVNISKEESKASTKKPNKDVEETFTEDTDTSASKPIKASGNKGKGRRARNDEEAVAVDARQTRSSGRSRNTKVNYAGDEEPTSEPEEPSAKAAQKSQATKNTTKTKKTTSVKAKDVPGPLEEDVETSAEEAPKAKKGNKKAAASKKRKL